MDDRLSPVPELIDDVPVAHSFDHSTVTAAAARSPRSVSDSGTFAVTMAPAPTQVAPYRPRQVGDAAELVRDYLRQHLEGSSPTVGQVARGMGLGKRTLQRRLRLLGTSYQALLDDVRRERFEGLSGSRLRAADIADALGYSDARCLRRWRSANRDEASE